MPVDRDYQSDRDTHPVSHLLVACISNRLLLMLTVAVADRTVAAVGGFPSDSIHTVAERTLVSHVMLETNSMAEEACGFLQPLASDCFHSSTTLVSHWTSVVVVEPAMATESIFVVEAVSGCPGRSLSDRFRTCCWL